MRLDSSSLPIERTWTFAAAEVADVLNLLAHLTGGQYFWVSSIDEALHAGSVIASDLRHQYVLGFSTSDSGTNEYRELEVTTRKKKVTLTFRRGYKGPPPRVPTASSK